MKTKNKLAVSTGANSPRYGFAGADRCRISVPWEHENNLGVCPLKNGKHNPTFYVWLRGEVKRANDSGRIPQVILLSTAYARTDEWKTHGMNAINGGPISGSNGVSGIYNNPGARALIFEICMKIQQELPPVKYNFEWFLMWENDSGANRGGIAWAAAMTSYIIDNLRDPRPVGTGTRDLDHIAAIEKITGHRITMYVEAWNFTRLKKINRLRFLTGAFRKYRIQFVGFWESNVLYYEQKNKKKKAAHFAPGRELENIKSAIRQICIMILHGINPSSVFDTTYSRERWRKYGVIIPKNYDMAFHRRGIEEYFSVPQIRKAIERPELMNVSSGRKALKSVTQKYVEGLRK